MELQQNIHYVALAIYKDYGCLSNSVSSVGSVDIFALPPTGEMSRNKKVIMCSYLTPLKYITHNVNNIQEKTVHISPSVDAIKLSHFASAPTGYSLYSVKIIIPSNSIFQIICLTYPSF